MQHSSKEEWGVSQFCGGFRDEQVDSSVTDTYGYCEVEEALDKAAAAFACCRLLIVCARRSCC